MGLAERVAELEEIIARFRATVEQLQEELRAKDGALAAKDERIKELEAALQESHRAGKRQASPFSKGEPKKTPSPLAAKPTKATAATATAWHRQAQPTGSSTHLCLVVALTAAAR